MFLIMVSSLVFMAIISICLAIGMDEPKFLIASLMCVVAAIVTLLIAPSPHQDNKNICLNLGYVEVIEKGNNWYCVSYGMEPQIMQLETDNE